MEHLLKVEFIQDVDIAGANAFYNDTYRVHRSMAQWHWEFDAAIGGRRAFVVAKVEERIVGTQALMPITMITPDGPVLTAKSEETLVDPSMRGKGVFPAMYQPLLEHAAHNGIQAIWGFTPAYKPFEGVGFSIPARTQQLIFPLSARVADVVGAPAYSGWRRHALRAGLAGASLLSSARAAAGPRAAAGLRLAVLDEPPASAAELSQAFVRTWGGTTIHRDASYLRWRFYQNPNVRATMLGAFRGDALVGWIAYSLDHQSMGYLVDALIPRSDETRLVLQVLIAQALRTLRAAGAVGIRAWHLNAHPFDKLLLEVAQGIGFYRIRRGEPVVLRLEESLPIAPSLRQWDQWFVTRAFTQGDTG